MSLFSRAWITQLSNSGQISKMLIRVKYTNRIQKKALLRVSRLSEFQRDALDRLSGWDLD